MSRRKIEQAKLQYWAGMIHDCQHSGLKTKESMPEFMSLLVPAEPANVPVESAIRSYAIVTMHIGKARIEAEWDKLLD